MNLSVSPGWTTKKIGELCDIGRGSSPRPIVDQKYFEEGTIPWIKIADATASGKYLYETKQYVNEYGASFSKRLPAGSLIVAASGTLGYTQLLGIEGCVHDGWMYLINLKGIDKDFLYYTLQWMKQHFYNSAYGATIQNVNTTILRDTVIPYPPLPVQRKIGEILSAYDDVIENNTRRIKILEEMAQMIYREWFVKFRFPGHEKVKMVDSAMGDIPAGWEVVPVTKSVEINPRTTVSKAGEKPFVPMGSLANDSMLITNVESRTGNSGSKFKNEDTLFARITPCLENGKTGYVQFLPSEKDVAFGSTEFIVLRSKTLCPAYVYLMSRSEEFRDNAIKSMSGATGRQRVSDKCFEQYFVAQPDSMTLVRFTEHVSSMFKAIHNLASRNDNLRQTRDLLLPRLVSGEVDVEKLEIETKGLNT